MSYKALLWTCVDPQGGNKSVISDYYSEIKVLDLVITITNAKLMLKMKVQIAYMWVGSAKKFKMKMIIM